MSQKLQSLQNKKQQCQKNVGTWAEKNEQLRTSIEEHQADMEDNGQGFWAETWVEAELDLEITGLQAGEGRRGSNASQSNGCCFDATILQQYVAMGAEQAMQQTSATQGEFSK